MTELHVRNVPADLHELLKQRAASEGRSMSAQTVALLREALQSSADRRLGQRAAIDRLTEIRRRSRLPAGASPAERLVREDRDVAR